MHQLRTFPVYQSRQCFPMLGVNLFPLQGLVLKAVLLMVDEVAPVPVVTIPFLCKGMTPLCLVGSIGLHVDSELLRPMSELALFAIRTMPLLYKVFAERTLSFGGRQPGLCVIERDGGMLKSEFKVIVVGGDI